MIEFFFKILLLKKLSKKLIFLFQVYGLSTTSKCDLLIVLITAICDMICEISYLTQDLMIIFPEIVHQSSCTITTKRDKVGTGGAQTGMIFGHGWPGNFPTHHVLTRTTKKIEKRATTTQRMNQGPHNACTQPNQKQK